MEEEDGYRNDDGVDDERQSVVYVQLINFSRTKNANDDNVRRAGKFSRISLLLI